MSEAREKKEKKAKSQKRKRREQVTVACDCCRRTKIKVRLMTVRLKAHCSRLTTLRHAIQCDGNRPACAECLRRQISCEYAWNSDENATRQEAVKQQLTVAREQIDRIAVAVRHLRDIAKNDWPALEGLIDGTDDSEAIIDALSKFLSGRNSQSRTDDGTTIWSKEQARFAHGVSFEHSSMSPVLLPFSQPCLPGVGLRGVGYPGQR